MKYIDKIREMSVDELAQSLKKLTDLFAEEAIKQFSEKHGIKTEFVSLSDVEDFKYSLLSEVKK